MLLRVGRTTFLTKHWISPPSFHYYSSKSAVQALDNLDIDLDDWQHPLDQGKIPIELKKLKEGI